MNKILVTGSSGLVGRCFNGEDFHGITSRDGDLRNPSVISNALSEKKYEGLIHCAGRVGGVLSNSTRYAEFFYDNITINTNVIHSAYEHGIEKLVYFSSTCVFPDKIDYPLSPDKIHLGPPHDSNFAYAYAKRMGQVQIEAYRRQYGVNYFTVIPCNIYGPGDYYNITDGHVIPSLIHKMYLAMKNNQDFYVWGTGKPLREFIYSEDVAKLTMNLYNDYHGSEPVILSTSQEISIIDIVHLIAKIFAFKGKIVTDPSKPDGQLRKPSDNSVIREMYPDFKFTNFEDGLEKSISWFIGNYDKIRK